MNLELGTIHWKVPKKEVFCSVVNAEINEKRAGARIFGREYGCICNQLWDLPCTSCMT